MKLWHSSVIIVVLLAIDLVSKIWIRTNVPLYELTTLIPNFIVFKYNNYFLTVVFVSLIFSNIL